jgi:hypothetical protein
MATIEEIKQMVRDLRDSDANVCEVEDTGVCTCRKYDEIIDALDDLENTDH